MAEEKSIVEEAIEQAKTAAAQEENVVEEQDLETVDSEDGLEIEEEVAEEEEQDSEEESEKSESKAEAKKRKKEEKKKNKIDPRDEKIEELTDRVARQMAEFDNFRKRSEKEKSERYEMGARDVVEKMLPIVDNFERGFQSVTEEDKENPFVDGIDKVYKQLLTVLEGLEVKPIPAAGEAFNPELHNAVMHIEDETLGANVVAEVLQKGYILNGKVIRPSMVKAAN